MHQTQKNHTDPSGHTVRCIDGERCVPVPPNPPTGGGTPQVIWLLGKTQSELEGFHQWQYDGNNRNNNECAVTSLAMAANLVFDEQGVNTDIAYNELADVMDEQGATFAWTVLQRTHGDAPSWMGPGATRPGGLAITADLINMSQEDVGNPGFLTSYQSGGTPQDLLDNLTIFPRFETLHFAGHHCTRPV